MNQIEDALSTCFVFHSFTGDKKIVIEHLTPIQQEDFQVYFDTPVNTHTSREEYNQQFDTLKKAINQNEFRKVILSRTKKIESSKNSLAIFTALNTTYSNTFNYIISNPSIGTWIGATPETLVNIENTSLKTMSLAGTKTADKTWTAKELDEQKIVTDSITAGLNQINCKNINANGPQTIQAGKVQHLKTVISATLETPNEWAKIVRILHPTPAVCGVPKSKALTYIPQLEKHNRQFYTGFVGIVKPNSKQLFVNLRCMQHYKGFAKLYLGGGITAGSNQEDEWNETEKKGMTLATIL